MCGTATNKKGFAAAASLSSAFGWIHWNMNYHIEHHMFPMVPYHWLPELQQEMLRDCPPPYFGF
jgi:fatty acid desaturase